MTKNPYKLPIKHHIIPCRSIERFYSDLGCVNLHYKAIKKEINAKANNNLFYGKKIWDKTTESVRIKYVEDNFQQVADSIIKQDINKSITDEENIIITQFYSLWLARQYFYENPEPEIDFGYKVDEDKGFAKDERELLESKGVITFNNEGKLSSHFATGLIIMGET